MKVKITPFRSTLSICPVCKKQIAARLVKKAPGGIWKNSVMSTAATVPWYGEARLSLRIAQYKSPAEDSPPPCPSACGYAHAIFNPPAAFL